MGAVPIPEIEYKSAPFNGPFQFTSALASAVSAAGFEGVWIPAGFAKEASIEVDGTMSTLAANIIGSNADNPINQVTITVGGSVTTGDKVTISLTNPNLTQPPESVSYTAAAGDTTATIASALAAAINADATLENLGYTAVAASSVITLSWPSVAPNPSNEEAATNNIQNGTSIASSVSGSATETVTVGLGTNGHQIASLTALGITQLAVCPVRWIKCRIPTLTGVAANITVTLCGAA